MKGVVGVGGGGGVVRVGGWRDCEGGGRVAENVPLNEQEARIGLKAISKELSDDLRQTFGRCQKPTFERSPLTFRKISDGLSDDLRRTFARSRAIFQKISNEFSDDPRQTFGRYHKILQTISE